MGPTSKTARPAATPHRRSGKRIGLIVCSVILLGLFLLYTGRNWLVKTMVERVVQQNLGMTVAIGNLQLDPWHGHLEITDLKVFNPHGFEHAGVPTTLARIPSIRIRFDLAAFFLKHRVHLTDLELNLYEAGIVKNWRGELNLNRIQSLANQGTKQAPPKPVSKTAKPEQLSFRIDRLVLTATQVVYEDYSKAKPKTFRIRLGINQEQFANLDSLDEVVRIVVSRVVVKAGLYNLGLPLKNLTQGVKQAGGTLTHGLKKAATDADRFLKGIIKK